MTETNEWTTERWLADQAGIPEDFTDTDLLRAVTAYTRMTAVNTKATKVAVQWAALGVWVIALAVLAGLFGLVTIEFRPL